MIHLPNRGMATFTLIWSGQVVSLVGTALTRFALLLWLYEQTGSATAMALLGFFSFGATVLVSPLAGAVVDRLDRRWVLIGTDMGAGVMTGALLLLHSVNGLEVWHLYVAEALTGLFEAFQIPAFSAATTMLVPKLHYTRASGMRSLGESASEILAPLMAGGLLAFIGLAGVMAIDIATVLVALATLLVARIPRPPARSERELSAKMNWREIVYGFRYIVQRRGLFGLLLIFAGINLFATLTYFALLPTMILARSGQDRLALARVQAALGAGGLFGGLCISLWGGPQRRIHGVLAGAAISFLLGDLLFALGRDVLAWMIAAFVATCFVPFIVAANRAIWQSKVPPHVQGRVFAVQTMLQRATMPLGYLAAGPLADDLFEPAMAAGGVLAPILGKLVGTGPGAGMAVMFVGTAVLGMTMSLSGYAFRAVRCVEEELPDHDAVLQAEASQP